MADKYEETVKLLDELQAESGAPGPSSINISSLFTSKIREGTESYESAVSLMNAASSRHGSQREVQPPQPKAASPSLLQLGLQKSAHYENEFAKQSMNVKSELREMIGKLNTRQPEQAMNTGIAPERAGSGHGGLSYAFRKLEVAGARSLTVRKVRSEDLVLPKLSVTDQIGELEKIITGLKEGAFNSDQVEVVEEELYGLGKEVRRGHAQPVVAESNLLSLRNERLNEATMELEAFLIRSGK